VKIRQFGNSIVRQFLSVDLRLSPMHHWASPAGVAIVVSWAAHHLRPGTGGHVAALEKVVVV